MATRVIAAQDKTSSGAGDDVQIKAGNANTSGAGGHIIIQPGAQATTGGNGLVIVRQPAGTAGTDEIQLSHDGGKGSVINKDGVLQLGGSHIALRTTANNAKTNLTAGVIYCDGLYSSNVINADGQTNDSYSWAIDSSSFNWNQGFHLRVGWSHIKGYANCGIAYTGNNTNGRRATLEVTDGSTGGGAWAYRSSTTTVNTSYNDLYLSGHSAFQRLNATAATTITGIAPASTAGGSGAPTWIHTDGRIYWLYNIGTFNITLVNESASSTAGNRIITQTGADVILGPGRMMQIVYDGTSSRWRAAGETYPYVFPTTDGTNGQVLTTNGSGTLSWTTVSAGASASGTTNYVAKFTGASALGNSLIFDNGTGVGIGTTTINDTLNIYNATYPYIRLTGSVATAGMRIGVESNSFAQVGVLQANMPLTFSTSGTSNNGYNERMRITHDGNVGIATASPTTGLDVVNGLRVRQSSANSSAALIELSNRNSTWSMGINWNAYYDGGNWRRRTADYPGAFGLSSTGDLSYYYAGTAAADSTITFTEAFRVTNAGLFGINSSSPGARLQVDTGATGTKGQIIKAFLGQSANLSEWQNSTGTVLASIDSAGRMTLATGAAASNADLYFNNSTSVIPAIKWNGNSGAYGLRFYSGTSLIGAFQDNGAVRGTAFGTWGGFSVGDFYVQRGSAGIISFGSTAGAEAISMGCGAGSTFGYTTLISTSYAATRGLVVKGVASQTANLQEWQNNSGTVLASVSSAGQLNLGAATSGGKQLTIASNAGNPGILIYKSPDGSLNSSQLVAAIGTGSSSSNTGTSGGSEYGIINVYHNGTERARLYAYDVGTGQTVNFALDPFAFGASTSLAQVYVTPKTNAIPGIIVRGKASQTANLTEWQDSTGTVVAAVSPTGAFTGSSFTPYGTINSTTTIFGNNYWTPNLSGVSNPSTGTFTKTTATAAWDSQVYSSEGYTKNVYCAARASQTNGAIMFGLNSDPAANASYSSLDYAWYFEGNSNLYIYENNAQIGSNYGTYTTSTVLSITYDGENVRYWKDGVLQRTVARSTGNPLYFDTSFYTQNASLNSVQFGPIGQPFGISGTAGYHPKFTSQQTLGNSIVYDNGTSVIINGTSTNSAQKFVIKDGNLFFDATAGNNNPQIWSWFDTSTLTIKAGTSSGYVASIDFVSGGGGYQAFSVASSEKMRLFSSGNLGIGAGARIGSGTGYINAGATAAGYLELYNSTSGATTLMNTGAFNVLVGTNNTERIRVTSSGLVGIGTSTIAGNIPLADLHVNDASGYGSLQLSQSPYGATIDTGGEIQFAATYRSAYDLTQVARIRGLRENATNNNWAGYLAFYTSTGSDNPSASTERMRINSSGNVGIGNVSPGARLQVDTGATGTKGQIIRAFLGQTANLTEWQNSSGAVLAYVNPNGLLRLGNTSTSDTSIGFTTSGQNNGFFVGSNGTVDYISSWDSKDIQIWFNGNATHSFTGGGRVHIGGTNPGSRLEVDTGAAATKGLIIQGFASQTANLTEWQNNSGTALAYMDANGNFAAVTKSFLIPHPTPAKAAEGKKLRYASLEGPENGVYFRGTLTGENEIILPDYWKDLVDPDSITVNLTARKRPQPNLFVVDANAEKVIVESDREICCDFIVYATRKDIAKLEVEIDGNGV